MKQWEFSEKFVLRSPLFPINQWKDFSLLFEQGNLAFEDALFLASPNLSRKFQLYRSGKEYSSEELLDLKKALFKYWTRAHMRSTPFGLFANCSLGNWGPKTCLQIGDLQKLYRSSSLDMNYLCQLGKKLERNTKIKEQLLFFPNSSIYKVLDKIRYVFYVYDQKLNRKHQLQEVELSLYLEIILDSASEGARLDHLANKLVDDEISLEEARAFIEKLVEAQLLVSELEVAISGEDYLNQILTCLQKMSSKNEEILRFIKDFLLIKQELKSLDNQRFNSPDTYLRLAEKLKKFDLAFDLSKLFQTDSFKDSEQLVLEKNIQKDISYALDFLHSIQAPNQDKNWQDFLNKFEERYPDRKVKLQDVLDTESGIGFPISELPDLNNPVVDGIGKGRLREEAQKSNWTPYEHALCKLIQEAEILGKMSIDLQVRRKSWETVNPNPLPFPPSIALMLEVLGKNHKDELYVKFDFAGGSSGINLLSRFSSNSQEIREFVEECISVENDACDDCILAELIHLPQARSGNILKHPAFLDYEIVYLGKSSLPSKQQIVLSDLVLFIDQGRLVLWSEKYQKEVLPRLSNAHNFANSPLPVYRFLSAMQYNGLHKGLSFSWGNLRSFFQFFPRICYGKVILSEAQWQVNTSNLKTFKLKVESLYDVFEKFAKRYNLPSRFLLVEGDNKVLIDLNVEVSRKIFEEYLKTNETLQLKEFLYDHFQGVVKDSLGNYYTQELISILYPASSKKRKEKKSLVPVSIPSMYPPGSEWLYFKIYGGEKILEQILVGDIKSALETFKYEGIVEKWFFIRYADPEKHLRLRLKLKNKSDLAKIQFQLFELLNPYLSQKYLQKLMLDTYEQEIQRYGIDTMELSESWFYIESENVVEFLSLLEGEEGERYRWQYVLVSIEQILMGFGFGLEGKKHLMENLANAFFREFELGKGAKKSLSKKFRDLGKEISDLLEGNIEKEGYEEFYRILKSKRNKANLIYQEIAKVFEGKERSEELNDLIRSYIHMLCNRVFLSNQRFHEMVVYDLLARHYRAKWGRLKTDNSAKNR